MIYIVGLISGIFNGFFGSGAGQLIVFYLVFIKKIDTYISRGVSILIITIASLFSLYNYYDKVNINYKYIIIILISSCIFGYIGSKVMKIIKSRILNVISGFVITILSILGLVIK